MRISWSGQRSRNTADVMPSSSERTIAMTTPINVSCTVSGSAVVIVSPIDCLVITLTPKSPCSRCQTNRPYCTGHGSSSPFSLRNCSSCASVAFAPSNAASAGSTGEKRITMNTNSVTPNSSGTSDRTRPSSIRRMITCRSQPSPG
jgi:hypothetical protein